MPNTLYLVASPIGNLNDVSPRVKEVLNLVSFVACEDTRNTSKLLSLIGIKKPCISCHEHNEKSESEKIVNRLKNGEDVAYLSDAGYPCISDPGFILSKLLRFLFRKDILKKEIEFNKIIESSKSNFNVDDDLMDDEELVAVITAAISSFNNKRFVILCQNFNIMDAIS